MNVSPRQTEPAPCFSCLSCSLRPPSPLHRGRRKRCREPKIDFLASVCPKWIPDTLYWAFTGVVAVAFPARSSPTRTPLDDHWCFKATVPGLYPLRDSLIRCSSSWMSSSPAYILQNFPVLADLASEHTAGPSLTQTPGNSNGGSVPANHAPTAASKYSNTRSPLLRATRDHRPDPLTPALPPSLRVPCVMCRSITTKRIACSARLFVGCAPGVVTNVK